MMNTFRLRGPALIVTMAIAAAWANHSHADAPVGHYVIANGTVYDTKTQLTWQQIHAIDYFNWDGARAHCQNLMLDGSGWRVPSVKELQTLVDESRVNQAIDVSVFPFTAPTRTWTSTQRASNASQAWLVSFASGATATEDVKNVHPVRCVR